jgi:hypothetical protein
MIFDTEQDQNSPSVDVNKMKDHFTKHLAICLAHCAVVESYYYKTTQRATILDTITQDRHPSRKITDVGSHLALYLLPCEVACAYSRSRVAQEAFTVISRLARDMSTYKALDLQRRLRREDLRSTQATFLASYAQLKDIPYRAMSWNVTDLAHLWYAYTQALTSALSPYVDHATMTPVSDHLKARMVDYLDVVPDNHAYAQYLEYGTFNSNPLYSNTLFMSPDPDLHSVFRGFYERIVPLDLLTSAPPDPVVVKPARDWSDYGKPSKWESGPMSEDFSDLLYTLFSAQGDHAELRPQTMIAHPGIHYPRKYGRPLARLIECMGLGSGSFSSKENAYVYEIPVSAPVLNLATREAFMEEVKSYVRDHAPDYAKYMAYARQVIHGHRDLRINALRCDLAPNSQDVHLLLSLAMLREDLICDDGVWRVNADYGESEKPLELTLDTPPAAIISKSKDDPDMLRKRVEGYLSYRRAGSRAPIRVEDVVHDFVFTDQNVEEDAVLSTLRDMLQEGALELNLVEINTDVGSETETTITMDGDEVSISLTCKMPLKRMSVVLVS